MIFLITTVVKFPFDGR